MDQLAHDVGELEDGRDRNPIAGVFDNLPVLPLEECFEPVMDQLAPKFDRSIIVARRKASQVKDQYPDLTDDDRAILTLYTMEMHPREGSFYYKVNEALRETKRASILKWKNALWLLLTAMKKLPQPEVTTLYRGAKLDGDGLGPQCQEGAEFTWSALSSTTTQLK